MPLTRTCLASENAYQKKGGLMCLAVLAEGCADHIRTKYVPSSYFLIENPQPFFIF